MRRTVVILLAAVVGIGLLPAVAGGAGDAGRGTGRSCSADRGTTSTRTGPSRRSVTSA